jgi:hypothetical protein
MLVEKTWRETLQGDLKREQDRSAQVEHLKRTIASLEQQIETLQAQNTELMVCSGSFCTCVTSCTSASAVSWGFCFVRQHSYLRCCSGTAKSRSKHCLIWAHTFRKASCG